MDEVAALAYLAGTGIMIWLWGYWSGRTVELNRTLARMTSRDTWKVTYIEPPPKGEDE